MGFTPFQLHMGHSPRIIPPLVPAKLSATVADVNAWHVIRQLESDIMEAQDNLLKAKISVNSIKQTPFVKIPFHSGFPCLPVHTPPPKQIQIKS